MVSAEFLSPLKNYHQYFSILRKVCPNVSRCVDATGSRMIEKDMNFICVCVTFGSIQACTRPRTAQLVCWRMCPHKLTWSMMILAQLTLEVYVVWALYSLYTLLLLRDLISNFAFVWWYFPNFKLPYWFIQLIHFLSWDLLTRILLFHVSW